MDAVGRSIPKAEGMSLILLGLGLYWGEGSKNDRRAAVFTNSDYRAIRAYLSFLREVGVDVSNLRATLFIDNMLEAQPVIDFWTNVTGIPGSRIYLTRTSSGDKSVKRVHGILSLRFTDADLSRKIFGWLRGISHQFANAGDERPF